MKIVVSGGTGFVGQALIDSLSGEHQVLCLTRRGNVRAADGVQFVEWDGRTVASWADEIDGADAVINLAGESIGGGRWTYARKKQILASRIDTTSALVKAVERAKKKPSVFLCSSAVGYYGDVPEGDVDESADAGKGFLAEVCLQWELQALAASRFGVRVAVLRTGVVVGKGGGALARMTIPFKLFMGGPLGSGEQWFPWVHRDDVIGIAKRIIADDAIDGPVNVVAPDAVRMKDFCRGLGKVLGRPSWAPVPSIVLKLLLGEMAGMLLTGQKVIPAKLTANSYPFAYPDLFGALSAVFVGRES